MDAPKGAFAYVVWTLYSLGLALALCLSAPWWLTRMFLSDRYREGLGERLGRVPAPLANETKVIWLHAVSVGEVLAAAHLVAELDAKLPDHHVIISTTTKAGQGVARQRFGADRVFYYPLDFAFAVRRFLQVLQPEVLILMESELWPRMLHECELAGISVIVANARVSDRSFPRYKALRFLWKPLLAKVRFLLAQSEEDAVRWKQIGASRVLVTGNMKFDVRASAQSTIAQLVQQHLPAQTHLLVCGSTLEGEESALLKCWRFRSAHGILLLAPRHPQRFADVAKLIEARGLNLVRLSQWRLNPVPFAEGSVLLLDSLGELAGIYSIANAAFLGGSIVPMGGHNPLEAAQFGVPVFMGQHYENFRSMVETMRKQNAIQITDAQHLCGEVQRALTNPDVEMGQRGRIVFEQQAGATERTLDAILQVVRERA